MRRAPGPSPNAGTLARGTSAPPPGRSPRARAASGRGPGARRAPASATPTSRWCAATSPTSASPGTSSWAWSRRRPGRPSGSGKRVVGEINAVLPEPARRVAPAGPRTASAHGPRHREAGRRARAELCAAGREPARGAGRRERRHGRLHGAVGRRPRGPGAGHGRGPATAWWSWARQARQPGGADPRPHGLRSPGRGHAPRSPLRWPPAGSARRPPPIEPRARRRRRRVHRQPGRLRPGATRRSGPAAPSCSRAPTTANSPWTWRWWWWTRSRSSARAAARSPPRSSSCRGRRGCRPAAGRPATRCATPCAAYEHAARPGTLKVLIDCWRSVLHARRGPPRSSPSASRAASGRRTACCG